ncbi:MAG: hypothetical protein COA42_22570 [Alteromonadaceae bacterium]|nr:MAG: hypothetical protein COA42_22570 [Alteromonadaceae bacterium]
MLNNDELQQLFQYAHALCDNRDDALDMVQSAVEKCLARHQGVQDTGAYLRKSIRNIWIDKLRKKKQYEPIEYHENTLDISTDSLDNIMINENLLGHVWSKLRTDERELLYMWAVLEYSVGEIAEKISVPRGTLLAKIHRMRKRIQTSQTENLKAG